MTDTPPPAWSEADSEAFILRGQVFTPRRDDIARTLVDLIPAASDDAFIAVEMGVGAGWLSEAVLRRFPRARVIGLDGSPRMLAEAAARLAAFAGRVELRPFRLEGDTWLADLPPARAVVSSLVIHHLDAVGKQRLYRRLIERLEPGGALLLCDLVAPTSETARRAMARLWDDEVRRQSRAMTGSDALYDEFIASEWNLFDHPDPTMDMPDPLPDHLDWLRAAGYVAVDAFWLCAGHAVYGGYRPV